MNKGIVYAASAYILWGFFPLYFHELAGVSAVEILAHRIIWSFLLLGVVIGVRREFGAFRASVSPRVVGAYLVAGALLGANWYVYVWAVGQGFVVEASLGYFINPLVSVLLGVIVLRERLRPLQWIPIAIAGAGVGVNAISYGAVPWIALALAFSFGSYGLAKKLAPLESLHGLALETTLLAPLAFAYLAVAEVAGSASFGRAGLGMDLKLVLLGVITVVPLLLFASGARRVPLTTLGLLQYFAPTLQFLCGVLVFREPMTAPRVAGFVIIWIALALFSLEGLAAHRRSRAIELAPAPIE